MEKKFMDFQFSIKSADVQESGIFTGWASTFGGKPDSHGHIVVEKAFTNTLAKGGRNGTGIAMLWYHDQKEPIGTWTELVENSRGLKVTGKLIREIPTGEKVFQLLKAGAVKHLSIGYDTIVYEDDSKKKVRYLKEIDLWEISLCVFPANTSARITGVKSAGTVRELEQALCDLTLSRTDAQRAISFSKTCEKSGGLSANNIKAIASFLTDNQYEKVVIGDAIALCETHTCGQASAWREDLVESVKVLISEIFGLDAEARGNLAELREKVESRIDDQGGTKEALQGFFRVAENANLHLIRTTEKLSKENLAQTFAAGIPGKLLDVSERIDLLETMAKARFGPTGPAPEAEPKRRPLTALENYERNGLYEAEPEAPDLSYLNMKITHSGGSTQPVLGSRAGRLHGGSGTIGYPGS